MQRFQRFFVIATIALLVFGLAGCGGGEVGEEPDPQPEPEVSVESTTEEAVPAPTIRQNQTPSFTTKQGTLVSNTGSNIPLSLAGVGDVSDSRVAGACSENLALVKYTTATYNEQWKSYDDEIEHFGYVDGNGRLAFTLDAIAEKYGTPRSEWDPFSEGRAVIEFRDGDVATYVVIDNTGKEILSSSTPPSHPGYKGGVLSVDQRLYDADGLLLYESTGSGTPVFNAGFGYIMLSPNEPEVFDYQGNVVFDLMTIAAEGVEAISGQPTGNVGIIEVTQKRSGAELYGLYSIPLNKWIIEPDSTSFDATYADELTIAITYGNKGGFGLIDLEGNWVMDLSETPTERSGYKYLGTKFCSLGNGWFVTKTEWTNSGYSKSLNTWGLEHVDGDIYELEDCDVLVDMGKDDIVFPESMS